MSGGRSCVGWRTLACASWAAMALACSPGPASPRPNLLLLTLDTTRADALGSYGETPSKTPRLDALAAESLRFTQAITTAPYTGPAHASMLSGLVPPRHGLRDFLGQSLPGSVDTLAEILRRAGYETAAFLSAYVLDPRYGLNQGFDTYESVAPPRRGRRFSRRPGGVTAGLAEDWLRGRSGDAPFFLWIHLFDPHHPYEAPPAFRAPLPADPRAAVRQRYLEEVRYMDSVLGGIFDSLAALGLWDDLIVVAVGDHGEMLGERGLAPGTHSPVLYDTTLRVPLLLRAPGRVEPGVEDRQVSVVDVFPTLLGLAGQPVPPGIDGMRLDVPEASRPRAAYSETLYASFPERAAPGEELASLRYAGWKLLMGPDREELYDLRADPQESRNLASSQPDRVASLSSRLRAAAGGDRARAAAPLQLSPEEQREHRERLRELGYVVD